MKTPLALLLIVLFVILAALVILPAKASAALREKRLAAKSPLDLEAMLRAIRQVETGDQPSAIGPAGERSAYQFTALTWRQYAHVPFAVATTNPTAADIIAYRHLQFVIGRLQYRGLPVEAPFVAAAWCFGPDRAADQVRSSYAQRAANLYYDYADEAETVRIVQAIEQETAS